MRRIGEKHQYPEHGNQRNQQQVSSAQPIIIPRERKGIVEYPQGHHAKRDDNQPVQIQVEFNASGTQAQSQGQ